MKRNVILICLSVFCIGQAKSQIVLNPNYGLKSHETLDIIKVENAGSHTILYMSVENKITGGYFCADKNIFIIYPDGTKSKLISSKGIPVCPDSHKFKTVGEKLNFELTFPALKPGVQWIDVVEDCSDNCFSFYGVCLNKSLNKKIDDASDLAENKEPAKALISFTDLANSIDKENSGMIGLVYLSIIKVAKETGNTAKAAEWYMKLKSSDIPRRDLYIKNLNAQGITY
jgi:hypothetical protein